MDLWLYARLHLQSLRTCLPPAEKIKVTYCSAIRTIFGPISAHLQIVFWLVLVRFGAFLHHVSLNGEYRNNMIFSFVLWYYKNGYIYEKNLDCNKNKGTQMHGREPSHDTPLLLLHPVGRSVWHGLKSTNGNTWTKNRNWIYSLIVTWDRPTASKIDTPKKQIWTTRQPKTKANTTPKIG